MKLEEARNKPLLDRYFSDKEYRAIQIGEVFKNSDIYIDHGYIVRCRLVGQECDQYDYKHYRGS